MRVAAVARTDCAVRFTVRRARRRFVRRLGAAFDPSRLDVPEIDGSVEYHQRALGAQYDAEGRITTFDAAQRGLDGKNAPLLYDRSGWGLFRLAGEGALEFLHNKTTNAFNDLSPGQGCDTAFCSAKGKVIDYATAYVRQQAVLVVLPPGRQDAAVAELEKFVFPGDNVVISDMRPKTRIFSLYSDASRDILALLQTDPRLLDGSYATHAVLSFRNSPVIAAKGNELDRDNGFTLIVDEGVSGDVYKNLIDAAAVPIGLKEWEILRVLQGRPSEAEISAAANPFEVDLFHAVSLDKGCFLGQESIARVYSRDMIRKQLWGIALDCAPDAVSLHDPILFEGREIGDLTSLPVKALGQESWMTMGMVTTKLQKARVNWEGKRVEVGGQPGVMTKLPYMSYDFPEGRGAPRDDEQEQRRDLDPDKDARMKAMQERLAAFMNQDEQS